MMHYIIVFENFRFHPPTRKRKAGVFKNLHSVITGHVWKVSLRTADAVPVVVSLPPKGGREATTGKWKVGQTAVNNVDVWMRPMNV